VLLGRGEVVIEDDHIGRIGGYRGRKFLHLALPHESCGFRSVARLKHTVGDLGSRTAGQFSQFVEGFLCARKQTVSRACRARRTLPLQANQNRPFTQRIARCRVLGLRNLVHRNTGHSSARNAAGSRL